MTENEWLTSEDPEAMLTTVRGKPGVIPAGVKYSHSSTRKLTLFVAACHRAALPRSPNDMLRAIREAEEIADGTREAFTSAVAAGHRAHFEPPRVRQLLSLSLWSADLGDGLAEFEEQHNNRKYAAHLLRDLVGNPFRPVEWRWDPKRLHSSGHHWTIINLAHTAYDQRDPVTGYLDPVRLSILADALEEDGCADQTLLHHLRGWDLCPMCLGKGICTDPLKGSDLVRMWSCQMCVSSPRSVPVHSSGIIKSAGIVPAGPHVRGCWAVDLLSSKE
jgi:hypothetical protein